MMFEVGERWKMQQTLCVSSAKEEDIRERCSYTIVPGKVYEIIYVVDPPINREDLPKIYKMFRDIENEFIEVGINYIGVSEDGREIVFQIFDPPGWPALIPYIIIGILIVLGIYFATQLVREIRLLFSSIFPAPPQYPWLSTLFWIGVSATLIGGGVYLVSKAVRWR